MVLKFANVSKRILQQTHFFFQIMSFSEMPKNSITSHELFSTVPAAVVGCFPRHNFVDFGKMNFQSLPFCIILGTQAAGLKQKKIINADRN